MAPDADPVLGAVADETALRRRLRVVVDDLGLQPPWDVHQLCQALAARRGRPIVLVPRDDLPVSGGFGCLVRYPDKDLIVFQQRSTGPGRAWIVFHELTHLIRQHGSPASGALWCGPPDSAPTGTVYDTWQEWEAETGAAILTEWAGQFSARSASLTAAADEERAIARGLGGGSRQ